MLRKHCAVSFIKFPIYPRGRRVQRRTALPQTTVDERYCGFLKFFASFLD